MKHAASSALIGAALALAPHAAHATAYGQFGGADLLAAGGHETGIYVTASDHAFGLLGQLRLSFYPGVDFGFQGGLTRFDFGSSGSRRTAVDLGADGRFAVARATTARPFDVALGAAVGVVTGDRYSVLTLGPEAVASRRFTIGQNSAITPYAGVLVGFSSLTTQGESSTDFALPVRLGTELTAAPGLKFMAELQLRIGDEINDHVGFATGVNLPF